MSDLVTIARPYAKAAFDFAVEKDALDQWGQMLAFAAEVTKHHEITDLLDGSSTATKLSDLFIVICGEQLDEYGQNLLRIMAANGRLKALPEVLAEFLVLRRKHEKLIDVEVISASELTKKQQDDMISKLEQRFERKVKLNCSIDETLLGGVIIRAGDLVIDNSARGRLDRLSDALQS